MKFTSVIVALCIIIGSITLLIALPSYVPDTVKFVLVITPVITSVLLFLKA